MRKYFGTDGIRGLANSWPMNAETAIKAGMAAGSVFSNGDHRNRVVIGKDTRLSGYMIESALVSGFTSVGMDVFLLGPMPTPAVAMLTHSLRADVGVMISASHNPYCDNGIKFFGPDGYKLSDRIEEEIEALMRGGLEDHLAPPEKLGQAQRIDDAQARYIEFAKRTLPLDLRFDGLRIVVDCAQGAAYKVAPQILWELGAEVFPIGVDPDGYNINDKCGSTSPETLLEKVREMRADIGIALDGDADRVLISDELGNLVDGDQLMALIAKDWMDDGRLRGGGVVSTVMSNLGLERYLRGLGLDLIRTQVGDRYVVDVMRKRGFNIGGEQSGHIVLSDHSTTGDGLVAALQVLSVAVRSEKPVSEICNLFEPLPQILENVPCKNSHPLENEEVEQVIRQAKTRLGEQGRLVIRPSGTEDLIRVMGEGDDENLVRLVVGDIVTAIERVAA